MFSRSAVLSLATLSAGMVSMAAMGAFALRKVASCMVGAAMLGFEDKVRDDCDTSSAPESTSSSCSEPCADKSEDTSLRIPRILAEAFIRDCEIYVSAILSWALLASSSPPVTWEIVAKQKARVGKIVEAVADSHKLMISAPEGPFVVELKKLSGRAQVCLLVVILGKLRDMLAVIQDGDVEEHANHYFRRAKLAISEMRGGNKALAREVRVVLQMYVLLTAPVLVREGSGEAKKFDGMYVSRQHTHAGLAELVPGAGIPSHAGA